MKCGNHWDEHLEVADFWEFILPLEWPSQNELGANTRSASGFKYRKFRAKFQGTLQKYAKAVPRATGWRRIGLIRLYGHRCRDYDYGNLVGGAKPLIDAMVKLGLLKDDSPRWFLGNYLQQPSPDGTHGILIRCEETVRAK